jgi:uncharacterized protein
MTSENPLNEEFLIKDEAQLRALFPATHALALQKCQARLDEHSIAFVARSPFLCIGTQSPNGSADVSPRGDPPGFVKVLDSKTLLIPDRPGNNRLDTLSNIVANPKVGLLFMIPGFDDTMRVNGSARVSRDPALLSHLRIEGKTPTVAIVVTVQEVFIHCAKAFRRSKLWDPAHHQDRSEMPSLLKIILDQTSGAPKDTEELKKIEDGLEVEYQKTMY